MPMPIGLVILIVGTVIGAVVGLFIGNVVMVGGAGFAIALTYLLIATWMDRREDAGP